MKLSAQAGSEMQWASSDDGAGGRIRTPDLLITNQLLYQLSYTSRWDVCSSAATFILAERRRIVNR